MNSVNKTLYIPLYGKAYVSKKGILLQDPKAEEIWEAEGFSLKGKAASKWLAYYMGMRSAVFDAWLREQMAGNREAVIVQVGCGMDSRVERVGTRGRQWFDVDFPEVIMERKRYYKEENGYHMVGGDIRNSDWLQTIPKGFPVILVMEGVSMYLTEEERKSFLASVGDHFGAVSLLMDCYTMLGARMSKYKNPIHTIGVTQVYGMENPRDPVTDGIDFVGEWEMTPEKLIDQLSGVEKSVFQKLYGGNFSKRLYKLLEYRRE